MPESILFQTVSTFIFTIRVAKTFSRGREVRDCLSAVFGVYYILNSYHEDHFFLIILLKVLFHSTPPLKIPGQIVPHSSKTMVSNM